MYESMHHESAKTSGTTLRYGPDVLRLIECPDFRAHYEPGVSPTTTTRDQLQVGRELDLRGHGLAERAW
jgi:hypothetical protein